MEELKEIAELSAWTPSGGDQLKLYKMAMSGMGRAEAKQALGCTDNYFNFLYKKLKDLMMGGIMMSDFKDLSHTQQIQFGIRKQYEAAMFLIGTEKKTAGVPLARAAIRKAEKYGMYQIALDLSRQLKTYYGPTSPNKKLFEYYSQRQLSLIDELLHELRAEDVYQNYVYNLKKGQSDAGIELKFAELERVKAKSWRFHYMRLICEAIHYQVTEQKERLLELCSYALQFFKQYDALPYVVKYSFYSRSIAIYITRRDFQQAEIMMNRCLEDPAVGKHNWQIIMFLRAVTGFHSGKPAIAYDSWNKVSKIPKKHQTEEMQERFQIIEAYLALMDFDMPRSFRLRRFMNSVPTISAEKSGLNVTVYILELMHLLKAGNITSFIDRCGQIDKYIREHLIGKNRERSIAFLRLMQCIYKGGFRLPAIERKAEPYLAVLKNTTPKINSETIEIVPFETLWRMAKGMLKK